MDVDHDSLPAGLAKICFGSDLFACFTGKGKVPFHTNEAPPAHFSLHTINLKGF